MIIKRFFFSLIIASSMIGCGERPIYSEYVSIQNGNWDYGQPLTYTIDVPSITEFYDLILTLSYGVDFGYQNIYVKIVTDYPTLETKEDIVSLNLTDGAGTFLGECSSTECTVDILLQEKFKFAETGIHTIQIYQHGRENPLPSMHSGDLKLYQRKEGNK